MKMLSLASSNEMNTNCLVSPVLGWLIKNQIIVTLAISKRYQMGISTFFWLTTCLTELLGMLFMINVNFLASLALCLEVTKTPVKAKFLSSNLTRTCF